VGGGFGAAEEAGEEADDEAGEEADDTSDGEGPAEGQVAKLVRAMRLARKTPFPYPNDPAPHESSNTAAHNAVRITLGIDSTTAEEQIDSLLRANPVVMSRLAATPRLYAVYETVAKRARVLVRLDQLMEERLLDENPSGEKAPKRQKLRKDGGFKQSGQKEGDTRTARTIYFKYEVVMYYRKMQWMKEQGLCPNPGDETVERFGTGITNGMVSAWAKQEDKLRAALLHGNMVHGRGSKRDARDKLVPFTSRAARRCTLNSTGQGRRFAAAEAEVHATFREKRAKGLPVTAHFLRITMKKKVKEHYGSEAAESFKASACWLANFTQYFGMSLRRKTNQKHLSVEERMPKCQRWHARFRRRLKGGPRCKLHPKWGRWLPEDSISVD
jgi:hypothetical protein